MKNFETPVVIVGAGPVGLTLAMDLAWRGIAVTVVETRHPGEPPPVKCNHVSARSMEIFHRLGVASAVREAGLPGDYPNDATYSTAVLGIELTRIPIPSRNERFTATEGPDIGWPTPEPPHRINQIYLEPVLFAHAAAMPGLRILSRTQLESITQTDGAVCAIARDLDSNEEVQIKARYLIGCDGARSTTRRQIGAKLEGDEEITRVLSTHIRAPALINMLRGKPAWMYHAINPRQAGMVVAIDGREQWLVHCGLGRRQIPFESIDRDQAIRDVLGVDRDFAFEVLSKEDWVARRLVADRFREGRVFLCGDSAHIWIPVGGYGMNAGIADAATLGWMLAATLKGWAPAALLDAYEQERRPITDQVSRFATGLGQRNFDHRDGVELLEVAGPAGDEARRKIGQMLYDLNVKQFCCAGLNFGYFYENSPIIAADGEAAPAYTMDSYEPSTVPGCRTPHLRRQDGSSLYDALGPDFTLIRTDPRVEVDGLVEAAKARKVPLAVLDLLPDEAVGLYDHALVLSRPDQHVAWRADEAPANPGELLDLVRGQRTAAMATDTVSDRGAPA